MLAQTYGVMKVGVMKSKIEHKRRTSGMGLFSRRQSGQRILIVYYRGKLVHVDLYINKDLDVKNGEEVMSVSVKELHT